MRRGLLVGALTAGLVALGGPAVAEPSVRIRGVEPAQGGVRVVLSGSDLGGRPLDPASVQGSLDGRPVATSARPVAAQAAAVVRKVVLVIDTSGSMQGPGLQGAKAAAKAFLAAVPADVQVGLVSFADRAGAVVPLTRDRAVVAARVDGLTARGETSLYDGVFAGMVALGNGGLRSLVVLSDGADTASGRDLGATLARVKATGTRLDAVAFRTDEATGAVLQQLAGAGAGRVLTAEDGAGLGAAFRSAAQDLAAELVVTVQVPAELAGRQGTLELAVTSGDVVLKDSVATLLPQAVAAPADQTIARGPRPAQVATGWFGSSASLGVALGALFAGLALLLAFGLGAASPQARASARSRRLLLLYTLAGRPAKAARASTALGDSDIARSAVELAGRVPRRPGAEERLAQLLDRAGVPLRSGEWLVVQMLAVLAGLVLGALLGGLPAALVLAGVGGAAPGLFLRFRADRRRAAFQEAMPDALQLMSGSLTAGFSLPQAIDAVSREGTEPLAGEFGRAVAEARLGVPVEDALDAVAERMDSQDFRWVVMAVRVQREVGGNLAEVLSTVARTMRDRASLRRQVRALSAEGRLSAYILIGLPIVMTAYLLAFRRDYLRPLYSEPLGVAMIVCAVLLLGVGSVWMKRVVTVEV